VSGHDGVLRRDELVLHDGIWHRRDQGDVSPYRQRWEEEARDDPVRSAIALAGSAETTWETLTAKVSPVWSRIPQGADLGHVLEIGAGYGRIPLWLARAREARWSSYTAVDISETMLTRLLDYHGRFAPNGHPLDAVCVSADALPVESDAVDTVLTSAVFLHMGKAFVHSTVAEIARVLRPGGRLIFDVSFPNARNPANLLPQLKPQRLRAPNYMKYWTRAELERLLERTGLRAKAAPLAIEAGSHALLPKEIGPVPVPLARRANRLAERAPARLDDLVISSYSVVTPELFT
jgi:arsenite methyltransferase